MTSGEFIDLENYLGSTETLHQAMAVLFRPIKSKVKDLYTIEEYESSYKYSEVLKYMPLDIALGSMLFFWTLQNDCVNALTDYIQNEVEQSEQAKQVLEKSMGWYQSIYAASQGDIHSRLRCCYQSYQ
jgi:hypothetical protein